MNMADYTISSYGGGISSLNPSYGSVFSGYRAEAGSLGTTTDPRMANVLKEVSGKIASGVKTMELAMVTPQVFDSVPNQQLKEVNRLSKLTGVDISLHGPVMDTTGVGQQGFSEVNRESSERTLINTIERGHILNPDGNISVTFHSSEGLMGSDYEKTDEGKRVKRMVMVNRETGEMRKVEGEHMYTPGGDLEKPKYKTPEDRRRMANDTDWDNSLNQLIFNRERADEILRQNEIQIRHLIEAANKKEITTKDGALNPSAMDDVQKDAYRAYTTAHNYLQDTQQHVTSLFDKAYRIAKESENKEQQMALERVSEKFREEVQEFSKREGVVGESKAVANLINELKSPGFAPEVYIPLEQFALEKSSKTFGNAAVASYKKFGETAPIINIENPPAGFVLSSGEELRELVERSRERFVDVAMKSEKEGGAGLSKKQAETQAEKLIGATWDVGHINMIRGKGFEEKDVVKETEKIAPYVKHVHLSDNFGFEHTELPMGMGNVPLKEIMQKLGKKGFEAKKIIEAGHWWQHFQTPPVRETMEALGSPIYSDGVGVGPYWNQSPGLEAGYNAGLAGAWLPQVNYETFGGGFSQLPSELGGQRPGAAGSRMTGRGME